MIGSRYLLALAAFFVSLVSASAQVEVQVAMPKNSFVAGEVIPITVTVTNRSGHDLSFQGNTRQNWIDFAVMTGQQPMTPAAPPVFGTVKLKAGESMSRSVSLGSIFNLQSTGNYSVYAMVRLPEQGIDGNLSNRLLFNVYNPRPYWTQKVGVGDGRQREFRVMNYSDGQKTMLYTQVIDERSGTILQTQSLGEALLVNKPSITVDNKQVMHVLYQINPSVWGHARIAADGVFIGRDLQKSTGGNPQLYTDKKGAVVMAGGIPYNPKAEAEAQSKVRKATDRPSVLFQ